MGRNVGMIDRLLRIIIGVVLLLTTPLAVGYLGQIIPIAPTNLGWIGIVPLLTGLVGSCPAYSIIGVSTCSRS